MKDNNIANYLTQLQLHTPPFADNSGEAFFYADPERSKYLDMLHHLLQYSSDMLLLTGEAGSGKTTLLEKLAARADEQWMVCQIDCDETTVADTLFAQIAACFRLQASGDAEGMLEALCAQLDELHQSRFPVLLIDDAQKLSEDALEMIMHLAVLDGSNGKLLHLILAGDKSLSDRLNDKRFSTLPSSHRLELEGLGEAHSAAYLMRRLQAAGHEGDSPFSVAELKQLHRETNGIPGQLNLAANQLLNKKYGKRFSGTGLRRIVQAGIAATALIGTVLGLQDRIGAFLGGSDESAQPVAQQIETTSPATPGIAVPEVVKPQPPVVAEVKKPEVPQLVVKNEAVTAEQPLLVVKNDTTQNTESQPLVEKKPLMPEPIVVAANDEDVQTTEMLALPAELKVSATEPEKVVGSNEPQRVILRGSGFRPGTKVALSRDGKVEILQQDLVEFVDPTRLVVSIAPGVKQSDWAVQVSTPDNRRSNVYHFAITPPSPEEKATTPQVAQAAPAVIEEKPQPEKVLPPAKPKPVAKPKVSSKRATSANGADWYSAQPEANYTLQLMASESRTNINAYIQQHVLPEPLARFSMQSNGRTLHVLTYGSFPSKAFAQQAAGSLPKGVKPWARSIASIRQVMLAEAAPATTTAQPSDAAPDAAWIWGQGPARFTIQLAAGSNESAVLQVKQQVTLPGELAVAKALRDGKPWYVLVYGSFSSKESARDTISRLPATLKQSGPWVRSFNSLQDELSRSTPDN